MTEEEWRSKFSKKLFEKMCALGVNQRDLADLAKIPDSTLSRYISGARTPKANIVVELAKALKCEIDELIKF